MNEDGWFAVLLLCVVEYYFVNVVARLSIYSSALLCKEHGHALHIPISLYDVKPCKQVDRSLIVTYFNTN